MREMSDGVGIIFANYIPCIITKTYGVHVYIDPTFDFNKHEFSSTMEGML